MLPHVHLGAKGLPSPYGRGGNKLSFGAQKPPMDLSSGGAKNTTHRDYNHFGSGEGDLHQLINPNMPWFGPCNM